MIKQIGIGVLLLIVAFNTHAQNWITNLDCATNPPDFSKLSYDAAGQIVIDEERKRICPEYITNLVYQIRHGKLDNGEKVQAVWLLGDLHPTDTDSIEVLIENIDLKAPKIYTSFAPRRWGDYPAEEGLVKIGKPAIEPICKHLTIETNELRRHLMCEVLKRVEGKEKAQNQIKQKLADESDAAKKTNLELALKELEK